MSGILVTGAEGFVGRHLTRALVERGHAVVGAGLPAPDWDADATSDAAAAPPPTAPDVPPVRTVDVCRAEQVEALVADVVPDAVVHLAAWSSAGQSFAEPRRTFEINGLGTLNLLEAIRAHAPAARVLVVTSAEIYGPCAPGTRHDEHARLRPVSPYGVSKSCQDLLTGQYATTYNLDAIRARPFSHTGPGQRPTFVLPGFAHQIAAIEGGRAEPELRVGRLDVERDYTDVRDVVACYCDILLKGLRGSVWNVCSGRGYRLDALLEQLLGMATVSIRVGQDPARLRPADLPRLVGDPRRVSEELGWQPTITMESTLADLIEEARAVEAGTRLSH